MSYPTCRKCHADISALPASYIAQHMCRGCYRGYRAGRRTVARIDGRVQLPAATHEFFKGLCRDAGNWGGTPYLDGGRGSSAMSQTLVRHGMVTLEQGEDGVFVVFTPAGERYASREFGIIVEGR